MNAARTADEIPGAGPSAIVVGLDNITGLQTSRILVRRGVRVVGVAADPRHPACRTNTFRRLIVSPTSGPALVATLQELGGSEPGAVLFPCTDGSVRTLAHATAQLGAFRVVLPAAEVVETLMDKRRFADLVAAQGLPAPATHVVTDLRAAEEAATSLRFPCVVKPSVKTAEWERAGAKVRSFESPQQWLAAAPSLLGLHPELVIQEWLPGGDECLYSCNFYVSPSGIPIVTFVARKLRQWPPRIGTSSLGEAVDDDAIRDLALQVISSVPFVGLGYVEIKRDPTTGADHLIEMNVGRPTGRSAIAEAAGVELLYTMYRDAIGAPLPTDRRQHDRRVKWVHLVRDVASASYYVRHGELSVLGWARSLRGKKFYADLDLRDPLPFLADVWRAVRRVAGRPSRQPTLNGSDPAPLERSSP
jgi:D-aspartate ligase